MSWRNPMRVNLTLEDLRRVIKICHEEWEYILIICEFFFGSWKALACPLHGECSLTLLVSQFRESEILIQVGYGRGHSDLSFGASWSVLLQIGGCCCSWSIFPLIFSISTSIFPCFFMKAHLSEWWLHPIEFSRCPSMGEWFMAL